MSSLVPQQRGGGRLQPSETPVENVPRLDSDHFEMGTIFGQDRPFELSEEQLATHSCVLGGTGSGKSKLLEQLMRYFTVARKGFALIDPHGDLAEDILAFAAARKASKTDPSIADRIHYLEPSFEQIFAYDPFQFRPARSVPGHLKENAYRAWLRAKADRVAEIFQRKQNQANFEGMPRLQRVLTDVLIAVGTATDANRQQHLPLSDSLILLDIKHPRHDAVFDQVRPHLDPEIVADFERIRHYRTDDQRLKETESTINRLRSLLSPIVKSIFSQQVEGIDFRSIVQNGEILLVNLRETDYFSADQRRALGGLFIHELLTVAQNEPREQRRPFHLIVDEAADFIADDIQNALGVMRKFQLSICLAAQDLSSFKKGDLDLRPKVLSQCGTIICFRQSWPEDTEILARVLATGNLDFEKHFQVMDRPDGYNWQQVVEHGEQSSETKNWGKTKSQQKSETRSSSDTLQQSTTSGNADTSSRSTTLSESSTRGESESATEYATVRGTRAKSGSRTQSKGVTEGRASTEGSAHTSSHSETKGSAHTDGRATTEGTGTSESEGGSKTEGESTTYRQVPLARHREELHESPNLKNSITDQIERIKQALHGLGVGEAVAKLRDRPQAVLIKTATVTEKWRSTDKFAAIERMKERCRQKPYVIVPDFAPDAAATRLERFIRSSTPGNGKPAPAKSEDSPFEA